MGFDLEKKYVNFGFLLIIIILSGFPLFYSLPEMQINMWDEAIYANNSIEMMKSDNILVVYYDGQPDLFNTKPPLVIWFQSVSMKLFGINEFAVRLPSGLFGLFTVLIVYFFCAVVLKSRITGLFSVLLLITSKGFVGYHVTRTGDLDATLIFWLTFYALLFITMLVKKRDQHNYYLLLISIGVIGGFLTKGVAGFFFLPALILISILFGNHRIYKLKFLYIYAFCTLLICCGYYVIRELLAPGYLEVVINSEIFRIKDVVASWQVRPFDYYFWRIIKNFHPYFYFSPLILIIPFSFKLSSNGFKISVYLFLIIVCYFLLISFPPVKLEWYDAPLYPMMAILIGLTVNKLIELLSNIFKPTFEKQIQKTLIMIAILLVFIYPYRGIIESVKCPERIYILEMDGAYLRYLRNNFSHIKELTVFKIEKHERIYDQVLFYKKAFEQQYDYSIKISSDSSFNNGEYVIATKSNLRSTIINNYNVREINNWKSGTLYKIISKKP